MAVVTVHHAKTHLSKLIADAIAGEEVIIARGSEPVAKLVPIKRQGKRKPGALKGLIKVDDDAFAPLTDEELREWGYD